MRQVEELWTSALLAAQHVEPPPVGFDGTRYHLAQWFTLRTLPWASAAGQAWSPMAGSKPAAIVGVGQRLATCARAPEAGRAAIERHSYRK